MKSLKKLLFTLAIPALLVGLASCGEPEKGSSEQGGGEATSSQTTQSSQDGGETTKKGLKEKYSAMSITEAIAQANANGAEVGSGKYYVYGVIDKITTTKWGNMVLKDNSEDTIFVYGPKNWNDLSAKPVAGDEIVVYGGLYMRDDKGESKVSFDNVVIKEFLHDGVSNLDGNGGNEGNSQDAGGDTTTYPGKLVTTAPVVGQKYKFAVENSALGRNFANGEILKDNNGNERWLDTTADINAAADVLIEKAGEGFAMKMGNKYIALVEVASGNKTFVNINLKAEPCEFAYDATLNTLVKTFGDKTYFLGTKTEESEHKSIDCKNTSRDDVVPAHFYTVA